MMKNLFKDTLQEVFEAEVDTQLGYKKHCSEGDNTDYSQNDYGPKTVKTKFGNSVS
jgi:transposase-like protein